MTVIGGGNRVRTGDAFRLNSLSNAAQAVTISLRVRYDDGKEEDFFLLTPALASTWAIQVWDNFTPARVKGPGTVVSLQGMFVGTALAGLGGATGWMFLDVQVLGPVPITLAQGYVYELHSIRLGEMVPTQPGPSRNWPGGTTWVFQGTVTEDATVGTHVSTLTVTPGVGNEMQVLYGKVTLGNTATAQTPLFTIDDGTNSLTDLWAATSSTVALASYSFPQTGQPSIAGVPNGFVTVSPIIISGTMRLILKVSTAAVSVTQTFAVVCRIKLPVVPTATLADSLGTPTLTTNTNAIFT